MNIANANTHWLFYKHYYEEIDFLKDSKNTENETHFKNCNAAITTKAALPQDNIWDGMDNIASFPLTTQYPGLVSGVGITHETGRLGELKLGFHFDYTTGMPVLPGSSVKGVLRSPFAHTSYMLYVLNHITGRRFTEPQMMEIENQVFEGKVKDEPISICQRDIFFDALITHSDNIGQSILGTDAITPHPHPLKSPNPIIFLKVLPKVTFSFHFRLWDNKDENGQILLSKEEKLRLFEYLLKELGVGAKTRVGYGRFQKSAGEKEQEKKEALTAYKIPDNAPDFLTLRANRHTVEAIVINNENQKLVLKVMAKNYGDKDLELDLKSASSFPIGKTLKLFVKEINGKKVLRL